MRTGVSSTETLHKKQTNENSNQSQEQLWFGLSLNTVIFSSSTSARQLRDMANVVDLTEKKMRSGTVVNFFFVRTLCTVLKTSSLVLF